jgi:hypothetical protein
MRLFNYCTKCRYLHELFFVAFVFFLTSISLPANAYVQANKYMLAGTTTHWGVDVSWFIQNIDGVENFKRMMDEKDNEYLLKELKKFNDAILFVIHPNVIKANKIDPEIATFATQGQLDQLYGSLSNFPSCSFRKITVASESDKNNVVFVFIYGYSNNGEWPKSAVDSCLVHLKDNFLDSGEP